MKKVWNLSVLAMCAALVMAQFAHVPAAEADSCDSLKAEQSSVISSDQTQADHHGKQSAKKFCCESCHMQMAALPLAMAEHEAPTRERILALPVSVSDVSPETLAEPPQA